MHAADSSSAFIRDKAPAYSLTKALSGAIGATPKLTLVVTTERSLIMWSDEASTIEDGIHGDLCPAPRPFSYHVYPQISLPFFA